MSQNYQLDCRYFNGYKPCGKNEVCDSLCPSRDIVKTRILLVHLEALGAVLRTTALLPAIRRKYPNSHITWITQKPADLLLQNNSLVDRILTISDADLLALSALQFDVALCLDKSLKAVGVLKRTQYDILYGFTVDENSGAIVPANKEAQELWDLGLNDAKKFFDNTKSVNQLSAEALGLEYQKDAYVISFNKEEKKLITEKRQQFLNTKKVVIGINTGCSPTIPYKKLSVEGHIKLIEKIHKAMPHASIVLLGGKEDQLRNQQITENILLGVMQSPCDLGMRDGLCSVAACDLVISGDSLGMHMAIACKKWVVAWFGPTCAQEIELYDRGVKVMSQASCSPCWKRTCHKPLMCYDLVALDEIVAGAQKGEQWLMQNQTSSSKLPSWETYFSPFR